MPLSFQIELTAEHVREATAGIFERQVRKPAVLWSALGLLAVGQALLWALLPQAHWSLHGLLLALMLLTFFSVYLFAGRYYQSLAVSNFRRIEGQPAQVRLDEEGYHYQARWGQGQVDWALLHSLWALPRVWVLLQHVDKGVSVLLPADALDEEARAFLKRQVMAHGGKVLA